MRLAYGVTALVVTFLVVYAPDVGHGFVKDDFAWISSSRSADVGDVAALFTKNVGFYRPLVAVSFAADYGVWGLNPRGYGITNLTLCVACALLLVALARRLGVSKGAAVLGAAVWVFNFHAVNMALLWLSGRTALLVTLLSLATALAVLRESRLARALAGVFCLGAMLCKEEAIMLPALFTAFVFLDQSSARLAARLVHALGRCWPLWVSMAVYAVLRQQSGAFGPADAPPYYQLSLSPALVVRNIAEYADRAATVGAAVVIVLILAVGQRPAFVEHERRMLRLGALWMAATYALTLFLPIRSSLYALLPSIGVGLAVGAVGSWAGRLHPARFRAAAAALVVLLIVLVPVYRSRNVRWVAVADVSARVMRTVEAAAAQESRTGRIVVIDSASERFNLESAFGTLFPDAVALVAGPLWTGQLLPPGQRIPDGTSVSFRLTNGRLVPARDASIRPES